jgi:hypothetical protein
MNCVATYKPSVIPISFPDLRAWLARQLRDVSDVLAQPSVTVVKFAILHAEPARYAEGDLVYADGSDWDPGSGVGLYVRTNSAWVKL